MIFSFQQPLVGFQYFSDLPLTKIDTVNRSFTKVRSTRTTLFSPRGAQVLYLHLIFIDLYILAKFTYLVWKNWKSEAKITTRAIQTFLWFFLFNVFFGYIWWQTWVYFDLAAFSIVQCSHKVECLNPNLDISSFLLLFFEFFV